MEIISVYSTVCMESSQNAQLAALRQQLEKIGQEDKRIRNSSPSAKECLCNEKGWCDCRPPDIDYLNARMEKFRAIDQLNRKIKEITGPSEDEMVDKRNNRLLNLRLLTSPPY